MSLGDLEFHPSMLKEKKSESSRSTQKSPELTHKRRRNSENFSYDINIGFQSHRERVTSITIKPDTRKNKLNPSYIESIPKETPGPGSYNYNIGIGSSLKDPIKGRLYSATKPKSKAEMRAAALVALRGRRDMSPGPGRYDIESGEKYLRSTKAAPIMRPADKAKNVHIERKKYWEEKARDLREEHDELREADDTVVKERVPTVSIRPDVKVGVTWRNRQILREITAIKHRERQASYDPQYTLIERRAEASVHMEKEVAVKESIQKLKTSKPGLLKVVEEKLREERARDQFLGPQLPVPWFPESYSRVSQRDMPGDEEADQSHEGGDSGVESPTEEVKSLLRSRQRRRRRSGRDSEAADYAKDDRLGHDGDIDELPDTTVAYLRSSLTGAPSHKPSVNYRPPSKSDVRAPDLILPLGGVDPIVVANRPFLTTQVHPDWKEEGEARANKHKTPAQRLDKHVGREEVEIKYKGEVLTRDFNRPNRAVDPLGPGVYDVQDGKRFGEHVTGQQPFHQMTARSDAVGPRGERPEAAVAEERALVIEMGDELDVDAIAARDSERMRKDVVPAVRLYRQVWDP